MQILKRFWLRLRIALKLLFSSKHGVVIYITDRQMEKIVLSKYIGSTNISYYGMREYQSMEVVKQIADIMDEVDIICGRAEFQAEVIEREKLPNNIDWE